MALLSKNPEDLLSRKEKKSIVNLIQDLESRTSGEIRIYIEDQCPYDDTMNRATEIFGHLGMHKTQLRNGVLLYIATESRKFCIFGDQAIYNRADSDFWQAKATSMSQFFKKEQYADGITHCLTAIGDSLAKFFPPIGNRKNELPDDIVFGKFN
jgi:uncharacterized membrane protein